MHARGCSASIIGGMGARFASLFAALPFPLTPVSTLARSMGSDGSAAAPAPPPSGGVLGREENSFSPPRDATNSLPSPLPEALAPLLLAGATLPCPDALNCGLAAAIHPAPPLGLAAETPTTAAPPVGLVQLRLLPGCTAGGCTLGTPTPAATPLCPAPTPAALAPLSGSLHERCAGAAAWGLPAGSCLVAGTEGCAPRGGCWVAAGWEFLGAAVGFAVLFQLRLLAWRRAASAAWNQENKGLQGKPTKPVMCVLVLSGESCHIGSVLTVV